MQEGLIIFAGTANPRLAGAIAAEMGAQLSQSEVIRYPDGELSVQLLQAVRGRDVVIVQPTSPPVDQHLVELLAFADACRRAAAARVTAVVPYFGYARGDKRQGKLEPIMASLAAHLFQAAGIDHVITVDLHTPQIEGFFHTSVDSLSAVSVLAGALRDQLPAGAVVVSPDAGRVKMATRYAQMLDTSLVVLHKERFSGAETEVTDIVGDVRGRPCLVVDDMITTGGTIRTSIDALLAAGAQDNIVVASTHGVLVDGAREKLSHPALRAVYVTDTIDMSGKVWPRLRVVSVAPLLAASIQQIISNACGSPA